MGKLGFPLSALVLLWNSVYLILTMPMRLRTRAAAACRQAGLRGLCAPLALNGNAAVRARNVHVADMALGAAAFSTNSPSPH
jgi:hypothetical protein